MTETRDLQAREKQVFATPSEQTRPGLVFTPAVDIFETDEAITLLADIPGVPPEDVQIDLRDNVLTLNVGPSSQAHELTLSIEVGSDFVLVLSGHAFTFLFEYQNGESSGYRFSSAPLFVNDPYFFSRSS